MTCPKTDLPQGTLDRLKGKAQLKGETTNRARLAEAIRQILRTAEGGAL
jgi:hypothetical protein